MRVWSVKNCKIACCCCSPVPILVLPKRPFSGIQMTREPAVGGDLLRTVTPLFYFQFLPKTCIMSNGGSRFFGVSFRNTSGNSKLQRLASILKFLLATHSPYLPQLRKTNAGECHICDSLLTTPPCPSFQLNERLGTNTILPRGIGSVPSSSSP